MSVSWRDKEQQSFFFTASSASNCAGYAPKSADHSSEEGVSSHAQGRIGFALLVVRRRHLAGRSGCFTLLVFVGLEIQRKWFQVVMRAMMVTADLSNQCRR